MSAAVPSALDAPPRFRLRREHGLLLLFVLVTCTLSLGVDYFSTPANLLRALKDQSHLGLLAIGMTLVILTGGIDLSVGSIVALSAVSLGLAWKLTGSAPLALLAAVGVGAACGACNGLLVSAGKVPPLIVTLATLSVFRGLAFAVGGSNSVGGFPPLILGWSRSSFLWPPIPYLARIQGTLHTGAEVLGIPTPLWLLGILFLGVGLYLSRTCGGRALYATGANAAAARLSGVPVKWVQFRVYLASGLLAGLAAILYAARNDTLRADIGSGYELRAITMVVFGGCSVVGGEGNLTGTLLGFLTLVFIDNGMNLLREVSIGSFHLAVGSEFQGLVVAALLLGALLMDAGFRRRALGR